jgi:malate synthase
MTHPCHLEPLLECIHLEGVCVARGNEVIGCCDLRHYLRDNLPKSITSLELMRDYEKALSPNKSDETVVKMYNITGQTGSDTYHRPDDDFGGYDGKNI